MQYAVNVPAGAWLAGLLCSYRPAAEGIETLLSAHNVGFWRRPIIQVTTRGPAEGELPIAVNTWGRQQVSESGATAVRSEHQGRGDFASRRRRSGVLECLRLVKLPPVGRCHCSGPPGPLWLLALSAADRPYTRFVQESGPQRKEAVTPSIDQPSNPVRYDADGITPEIAP